MLVLGIECTAHTFGIGIIETDSKNIIFNEKNQYKNDVGMDPRKITEFHLANFDKILLKAKNILISINKNFSDIDLISFSQGPGLGNSLKFAGLVAKTLAIKYNIPVIGVNHIKAHLEIGKMLTNFKDPLFLYVSGVNTQIIAKDEFGKYKIYGETEDIGLGNLFDSFARLAGLDFPGGPIIEKLANEKTKKGELKRKYIELPYSIKGMNISLAGTYSNLKQKLEKKENLNDLCYSLQETSFSMLMEIAERAMAYTNKKEFVIVGGVASNKRLTQMANAMCELRGARYDSFDMQYAMDNGVMIAWQGYIKVSEYDITGYKKSRKKGDIQDKVVNISNLQPKPYINIESDI